MTYGKPSISVALVTRNRPESLRRTLRSLRAQDSQPFEVVVSDDSDDDFVDSTKQVAEAYACRYIQGPRRGLYANRNCVARHCRGTHVRTMDDDHEFPAGHWHECECAVRDEPTAVWIIGEHYPGSRSFVVPPPCPGQLHPRGYSTSPQDSQRSWALADGASIFPLKVFLMSGGYYEGFVFGASYLEFGSRLCASGVSIRQLASTFVIHHYDPDNRSISDVSIDTASRVFAMWCFSFAYQRTFRNRFLTVGEFSKQILLGRTRDVMHGISSAKEHLRARALNSLPGGLGIR